MASRAGMRELAKPGGLGDFKVLAQGKNAGNPELWGFHASGQAAEITGRMPAPSPRYLSGAGEHLDLLAGRFPSAEAEFEMAWDTLWTDWPAR